ncbi:MAG: hypothetical protein IKF96_08640, partial [Eggerthellaceae bacterium]|nr:hypothetical protein [Eggerthellaceae bacterium]
MANMPDQKITLLHILKALIEKTDENTGLTVDNLIDYLISAGYTAGERKVRRDLAILEEFGFAIDTYGRGYKRLVNRPLEIEELTLLV